MPESHSETKPAIRTSRFEASEGRGDRRDAALERAMEAVRAAHRLGLDVALATEHSAQFRHGGNVTKAQVTTYVVTVTEPAWAKEAV